MAYKKPVIKAKLHNAAKSLSISDHSNLSTVNDDVKRKAEERQNKIDDYNFNDCFEIDNHFEGLQLMGKHVIVRLFKENYIKDVQPMDSDVIYDAWITQVDGRMNRSEQPKWVDNPLPYIWSGVVVAISPAVTSDELDMFNKLKVNSVNYEMLKVGDIVQLTHFMISDVRYYKNHQKRDFIKNPEEYRIENYEGYVKIHPTMVDCIVKDKETFLSNLSPFNNYVNSL